MGKYEASAVVPLCPGNSRFFAQSSKGKEGRECCSAGRNCEDGEDGSLAGIPFGIKELKGKLGAKEQAELGVTRDNNLALPPEIKPPEKSRPAAIICVIKVTRRPRLAPAPAACCCCGSPTTDIFLAFNSFFDGASLF